MPPPNRKHAAFRSKISLLLVGSALAIFFSNCTGLKYVPNDQVLYTGYEIVPESKARKGIAKKRVKEIMDENISPKPNTSIFGMRPGVWFYYIAGTPKKKKGLRSFIKNKIGQVPVYMSDVDADKTSRLIKGQLINNGFFKTEVRHEEKIEGKKGEIIYTATIHRPYRLRNIDYPKTDTLFANIDSIKINSYLEPRQRYNLERLKAEQERIEQELENYGYYFFDDRHLLFEADSTVGNKQVDLTLKLEEGVPEKAKRIYHLGEITIYPDYSLSMDSLIRSTDTLKINGYNYIDLKKNYRPQVITRVINLKKGNIYRREDREYTLSHLMSLGSFKFVDIKFDEVHRDSSVLNARIYLTPYLKKSLRTDLQATSKSNNFVGPGITVRFTNRNFLRGSERFDLTLNAGYEVQVSRKLPQPLNALELGAESKLSVPRFITPFNIYYPSRKYLPTTDIRLSYRLQQRISFFRLNSFNLGYGYTWRENTLKSHELFPIDISYMKLGKTSEAFQELMARNRFLARSLENQFIMGARYSYILNTQVDQERENEFREEALQRTHYYFGAKLESAGNLMQLIRGGSFINREQSSEANRIFGSAYAQFVRGEIDFRFFYNLDENNVIATRIDAGTGYAYGNSIIMPYIRQFSTGGSNSVRAFPARSVGPGTYDVRNDPANENNIIFLDQRGDVKLEGNLEYRFNIVKMIKGALFADAGNIWLWRPDSLRPGSQFQRELFLKQLAVGTGAGLRFDFSFFVLRLDLAFPIRKPSRTGHPWVWDQIDFGSSAWRKENLILNIAIGYPF